VAYVLQKRSVAFNAHGIRVARIDLRLVVLDSECTRKRVSGQDGRTSCNRAHT
jgi:hypothetical protein